MNTDRAHEFQWAEKTPEIWEYSTPMLDHEEWWTGDQFMHAHGHTTECVLHCIFDAVQMCADHKVWYTDAHPGNIMVRITDNHQLDWRLIDFKRCIAWRTREHDQGSVLANVACLQTNDAMFTCMAVEGARDILQSYFRTCSAIPSKEWKPILTKVAKSAKTSITKYLNHPLPPKLACVTSGPPIVQSFVAAPGAVRLHARRLVSAMYCGQPRITLYPVDTIGKERRTRAGKPCSHSLTPRAGGATSRSPSSSSRHRSAPPRLHDPPPLFD